MEVVFTAPSARKPSCSTCNFWIAVIITITSRTSCVINWKQIDVLSMWPYRDWIYDWEKKVGYLYSVGGCDKQRHAQRKWERESEVQKVRVATPVGKNGVYSLKWRLTERYPKWGTLADPRPGRAAADQWKSSEFLQELRISGFPRFGVSPTCFRAK